MFSYFRCSRERLLLLSSFRLSVCLLVGCISATTTGQIFVKFDTGHLLRKSAEKFQIWLKSGKDIGHFMWRPEYVSLLAATYVAQQYREHTGVLLWESLRYLLLWLQRHTYFNNKQDEDFCVSTAKTVTRMHPNITLYYIACLLFLFISSTFSIPTFTAGSAIWIISATLSLEVQTSLDAIHKPPATLWNYFIWILNFINICVM